MQENNRHKTTLLFSDLNEFICVAPFFERALVLFALFKDCGVIILMKSNAFHELGLGNVRCRMSRIFHLLLLFHLHIVCGYV